MKSWPFATRWAANLLRHEVGEDDVDLCGGIAALRLANDQLFVSPATQRTRNLSNQTTTFSEKNTDLSVPAITSLIACNYLGEDGFVLDESQVGDAE